MTLIPKIFINAVVAIGGKSNLSEKVQWIGTGFIVGKLLFSGQYELFLVTNKHVVDSLYSIKDLTTIVRFNPNDDASAKDLEFGLYSPDGERLWIDHTNEDVSVTNLHYGNIVGTGARINFFELDKHIIIKEDMIKKELSEGDSIFVLGYPMSLVHHDKQHVIVRSGIVSRIQDFYEGISDSYLVDSLVFPGNSGGPVVNKPEYLRIEGTSSIDTANLIGMVSAYIPYRDIAVSSQTGSTRVIFEENTGLAKVIPVDKILETINMCYDSKSEVYEQIEKIL